MSVIQSNGSITHTFGNVSCVALDYVKKYFSDDYFNHVHISTKLSAKQLNIFRTKTEFWKLHPPILILRPRIDINDDAKWFRGTTMMNRVYNVKNPMEFANRVDLIRDYQEGVMLQFVWNRYKIYYDVVMIVDTYNEQLNLAHYLTNMIVPDAPFFIDTCLESYIPKNTIYSLADYLKIDRDNKSEILRYLNSQGNTPFTYKFKDGSGNDEFFSLYPTRIEAIASEVDTDEGVTRGATTESYTVSFTVSMEFNAMGAYFLTLKDNKDTFVTCPLSPDMNKDGKLVPLLSIPLYNGLKNLPDGWRIIYTPSFTVTDKTRDVIDIGAVIDNPIKEVIKYQRGMHLEQDLFIKFRVFEGFHELKEGRDFEVDMTDLDKPLLITHRGNLRETYRLFVIVNNAYIHSITSDVTAFKLEK